MLRFLCMVCLLWRGLALANLPQQTDFTALVNRWGGVLDPWGYDGMLPVQELDTNSNVLVTYTRGLDLSGSRTGAGGIGGLLARTDGNGSTFYHADGAGNITSMIDGNQNMAARYLYSAFGRLIGQSGPMAGVNHMMFSSKELHPLSGLYHFGLRSYDPNLQRWLTRDPLDPRFDSNPYRLAYNSPLHYIDPDGLAPLLTSVTFDPSTGVQTGAGYSDYNFADSNPARPGPDLLGALGSLMDHLNTTQDRADQDLARWIAGLYGRGDDPKEVQSLKRAIESAMLVAMPGEAGEPGFVKCPVARGILGAKRLSEAEKVTASRLMTLLPELQLAESAHEGADYADQLGRAYDALGSPAASQFWNEQQFLGSISDHLLKSNDFTVIDLTGFTNEQINIVRNYINGLPPAQQARVIRIGF